jgi:hypothetical protein
MSVFNSSYFGFNSTTLIVPPGERKELERSVLDQSDVDSALAEIESLLKYA